MRTYVRWVQSQVAYWQDDFTRAAELAIAGQRFAGDGSSTARLACQAARSLAAIGDDRGVEQALATATVARDRTLHEEKPAGVFYFAPGKAAYYASEALLLLGGKANARRAATEAEEAITLFEATDHGRSPELVAAAHLDLVGAHLALANHDAIHSYLQPVLALTGERRTMPIVHRMTRVRQALTASAAASSSPANDLSEQIDLFCSYPAAHELPLVPE